MSKLFLYTMLGVAWGTAPAWAQSSLYSTDNLQSSSLQIHEELALQSVADLQQRNGEIYNPQIAACIPGQEDLIFPKGQLWVRTLYSNLETPFQQARQSHSSRQIQLGADLLRSFDTVQQSRQTAGVMLSLGQSESQFKSLPILEAESLAAKVSTDQQALAFYYTFYTLNGQHIDAVAQWSQAKNKDLRSISTGLEKSETATLSVQWGRPYKIRRSNWLLEPQAQLLAQQTHLKEHNQSTFELQSHRSDRVRLKLGARAVWNGDLPELTSQVTKGDSDWRPTTFYLGAYLAKDWVNSDSALVRLGLQEPGQDEKPWFELVAGAQQPIGQSSYLFGHIGFQKSLSGDFKKSTTGNLGLRVNW